MIHFYNKNIFIFLLLLISISTRLFENNILVEEEDDEIIDVIMSDNQARLLEALKTLNNKGGIIYINTPIINVNSSIDIEGLSSGGIIGLKQANDEYPRIDFINAIEESGGESHSKTGILIEGSNKYLKYLIIENSHYYGISIKGQDNTIDHVITRYNLFPGIYIYEADSTTLNYCYSYRNLGKDSYGKMGYGFSLNLGSKNTVFDNCYAWDNSNDGFYSFLDEGQVDGSTTSFLHSTCWNNGNNDVFSGKYDFDKGSPLDKKLWSIREIINSDENFENNFKRRIFDLDEAKINGEDAYIWLAKFIGYTNGNGFEFSTSKGSDSSTTKRIMEFSASFDHRTNGFNNYNSHRCSGYISNCASFNNKINYQLPITFALWTNNWSWGAKSKDQNLMDQTLKTPKNNNTAQKIFYSVRDQIIKTVSENKFPDKITFDDSIKELD